MPVIQGLVNPPSNTSAAAGSNPSVILGKQNDLLVSELHGKYYTQNYNGNAYYASTAAAGVTLSIFSNTSFTGLGLWNPQGSGRNMSIARVLIGCNAAAATAEAGLGYSWLTNAGASLGTAAPLSATTPITATRGSCVCGAPGQGNSVVLAVSAATLTTAMTWGRFNGISSSTGAITTQIALGVFADVFDGTMIVPPGTFWTVTSSIASGGTFGITAEWEETPL